MLHKIMGDLGQWLSLAFSVSTGVIALRTATPLPPILLLGAGITWGVATKIKYYGQRRIDKIETKKPDVVRNYNHHYTQKRS